VDSAAWREARDQPREAARERFYGALFDFLARNTAPARAESAASAASDPKR